MKNIEVAIENVGKLEIYRLERGMAILATISGAAPMLGFLGTVTGMISAFFKMAQSGNNIDITQLSGGIYEAMVTTVAGLIAGIFAYMAHNLLTSMIDKVVHQMEAAAVEFIDLLQEPA
jgi:biopolymer transport protein ExbB